jgi:1-deoxy-D-xylulose-5-phosphate reductoisomerase
MRLPIQYALGFPERWASPLPSLSLTQLGALRFFEPNVGQFPCLHLALEASAIGGTMCTVLNGANDVAVQAYLEGQIGFVDIPRLIAETLEQHTPIADPTLEDILSADRWSRAISQEMIGKCCDVKTVSGQYTAQ